MPQTPAVHPDGFRGLLAHHPLVVIHLWAPWNLHDLKLDRTIQPLITEYAGRIEFRSRNVDLGLGEFDPRIPRIVSIPALACFLRGRWLQTVIGAMSASDLRARLDGWLLGVVCHPTLYGTGPIADHG